MAINCVGFSSFIFQTWNSGFLNSLPFQVEVHQRIIRKHKIVITITEKSLVVNWYRPFNFGLKKPLNQWKQEWVHWNSIGRWIRGVYYSWFSWYYCLQKTVVLSHQFVWWKKKWKSLQATNINQPAQMLQIIKKEFLCQWQTSQYLCSS